MSAAPTSGTVPHSNGRPHPRLVSLRPQATTPPAPPRHPDERLTAAIHAARTAGYDDGERAGYRAGWRAGVGQTLLAGILLGALGMHAAHRIATMLGAA